jgi:hypothetical protein
LHLGGGRCAKFILSDSGRRPPIASDATESSRHRHQACRSARPAFLRPRRPGPRSRLFQSLGGSREPFMPLRRLFVTPCASNSPVPMRQISSRDLRQRLSGADDSERKNARISESILLASIATQAANSAASTPWVLLDESAWPLPTSRSAPRSIVIESTGRIGNVGRCNSVRRLPGA